MHVQLQVAPMSKEPNTAAIGIFVLGAISLLAGAVLIFSSDQLISDSVQYTLHFDGSVKGLNVGSPVTFRGAKLGMVTNIQVSQRNGSEQGIEVPVTIEMYASRIVREDGAPWKFSRTLVEESVTEMVENGLRASLELQSFVTGQLSVALEFEPDAKPASIMLVGGKKIFPTVPSKFGILAEELQALPVKDLVNHTMASLMGIDRIVNSGQIQQTLDSVRATSGLMGQLLSDLRSELIPAVRQFNRTLQNGDRLITNADRELLNMSQQLGTSLTDVSAAMKQAQDTLLSYQTLTTDDSAIGYQLNQTLRELATAARSVRIVATYLERHPEAMLMGKPAGTH